MYGLDENNAVLINDVSIPTYNTGKIPLDLIKSDILNNPSRLKLCDKFNTRFGNGLFFVVLCCCVCVLKYFCLFVDDEDAAADDADIFEE